MKTAFTKMSGAGNDFVVVDNRSSVIKNGGALARKVCDRRWGVGADGLLLLESSTEADYRMMYYNADGSYGGMCGNGGRCIARFAVERGIADPSHSFEALGYIYRTVVRKKDVTLAMKDPRGYRGNIVLRIGSLRLGVHFVDTGSPHVVIPFAQLKKQYRSIEDVPMEVLGPKIRYHKEFSPEGANVNIVERRRDNTIRMRTYERGVEAETLACGTGSIASAVVGIRLWNLRSPVRVLASSGVTLRVVIESSKSEIAGISLVGPAISTFEGVVDVQ